MFFKAACEKSWIKIFPLRAFAPLPTVQKAWGLPKSAKKLDPRLKDTLPFITRYINMDKIPVALGVGHLAQDSSVGAGQAFYGEGGAKGIVGFGQGGVALFIGITEGDLAGGEEGGGVFFTNDDAAFAMAHRHCVDGARFFEGEPRRFVRHDAGADKPGDVAADEVRRYGCLELLVFYEAAVGDEAGPDEGLETA